MKISRKQLLVFGLPLLIAGVLGTAVYAQASSVASVKSEPAIEAVEAKVKIEEPVKPEEATPKENTVNSEPTALSVPKKSPVQTVKQEVKEKNPFNLGWAAWYAFERRQELGLSWLEGGNDHERYCTTVNQGLFSSQPSLYAIGCSKQTVSGSGTAGRHVFVVERLNEDGSLWISDMNSSGQVSMTDTTKTGGFFKKSYRLVSKNEVSAWKYIK